MNKKIILGLSRIVDSFIEDSNKRLDEYILGSLRSNGIESLANIEEHEDGIRVSLQGYPLAYVDIYLDGEKVVADCSRNAQELYPGTVKKYAQFAGISEEQAKTEVEKFYKWMRVMKDHTGGLVDDIPKLKVFDSEEKVKDSRPTTDFIFPADSTSVNDNRGHFPIPDVEYGRNAIARVNQYLKLPKWYKGKMSLQDFVKFVVDKVKKKFPSIDVSAAAKVAKPQEVKDSDDWDEDDWDEDEEETPITCTTTTAYARKFADMLDDRRYDYTTSASNVFVISPSERFRPDGIEANLHYDMTQYGIPESEVEFEVMDSASVKGSKSMGMSKSKVADSSKKWYILRRDNPQLPKPYFKVYGQLSKKEANKHLHTPYGSVSMMAFDSKEEMDAKMEELKNDGYSVSVVTVV